MYRGLDKNVIILLLFLFQDTRKMFKELPPPPPPKAPLPYIPNPGVFTTKSILAPFIL